MSEKPSKEKTLASLYTELYKYVQNGDYERAYKSSNKVLQFAPTEEPAFECKIVCLLNLSKFDDALNTINRNTSLSSNLHFEKAYCLYRLNQPHEALKVIEKVEILDYRLKELKAQVLYRIEDYDEALAVYEDIVKNADDDYSDERETNLGAVLVHLSKKKESLPELREDTYELCFNKACLLVSQNMFVEAEKKLKACEKLCREAFEEDGATEDEIEVELALIKVQLGYVYQRQGRLKEAQQIYTSALKLKLDDIALTAVASNNAAVMNKDQNVFDSKKKIKAATNESLVHKLPSFQRKYIALNNAIFNYYTNQNDQCKKICANIEKCWPELVIYSKVLSALTLLKCDKVNEALEVLTKQKAENPDDALYLQLCCVHILLMQGDREAACKKLESLGSNKYKPAIIGALITLYLDMKKEDVALKIFEQAVGWYKQNKDIEGDLSRLFRQAAEFHIKNGHADVAAHSLEELLVSNPNDKKTIAQLIIAYSQCNKEKAIALSEKLFTIEELAKDVDIESLESSNWLSIRRNVTKAESSPGAPTPDSVVTKKRKNRKRKGKLPKNYDASATPDPERWLPKYERSGYRKKRDRRAKEVIKGSQGTASGQSDQYDFSKVVVDDGQNDTSAPEPSPLPNKNQSRKPHQKNKKNKRK